MTREEIAATLVDAMKEVAEEPVDWDRLTDDSSIEELGYDSLTILDLTFYIKEHFGIEIEMEELGEVTTFGQMVGFLEKRLAG